MLKPNARREQHNGSEIAKTNNFNYVNLFFGSLGARVLQVLRIVA